VVIDRALADQIVDQARREAPDECCGMLGLDGETVARVFAIENVEASPVFFKLHPIQQLNATEEIEDNGWRIGIYHSHTHSPARPSATDRLHANNFGQFYADVTHVIVSLADPDRPDFRAYRIDGEDVTEESMQIV
jgi:[CysO sulfur-carrier protein]-S-L-cysteine hydrolase